MRYWITSQNRKRHQREINRLMRSLNKAIEEDCLWNGRFIVCQYDAQWLRYPDSSERKLYVKLKFIDRATGRYYIGGHTVNEWRGFQGYGFRLWEIMNWLITEHWNVWKEDFAQERNYDAWREYNKNTRKV